MRGRDLRVRMEDRPQRSGAIETEALMTGRIDIRSGAFNWIREDFPTPFLVHS